MEEKVTVDYFYIKELLKKDDTNIRVILDRSVIYTWTSINNVLIRDWEGNNKSNHYDNIRESAKALYDLADKNKNFDTKDHEYKKVMGNWYKY